MTHRRTAIQTIGIFLLIIGIIIAAFVLYRNSERADKKLVFSDNTMLSALYNDYKKEYWEEETGRTLDKERDSITTSEGQSYTMLRAVWLSDQATFDKAWAWTQEQLQRQDNKLFSWKWGQKPDGAYGVLVDEGGRNTASDADVDIAFALLMAAGRWQQQRYLDEARQIIPNIWEAEVVTVQGKPYLASNNLEKTSASDAVMNPSYFAPYAYREFAKIDKTHDWAALVDSSYELINKSIDERLDKPETAMLPPDWFLLNKDNGKIRAPETESLTTNYAFDAIRTPWRLALDYQWHKEPRAKETLQKMSFIGDQWKVNSKLAAVYSHDGIALQDAEVAAVYGANMGYFYVMDKQAGRQIYDQKLKTLYDPNKNAWVDGVSYYSDNWAWFGMALFDEQLDNPVSQLKYKES